MYSLVIGLLVVFAIGILVLAMKMSERTQEVYNRDTAEYQAAVAERIKPVGDVYLPGEEQEAAAPVVETVEEPEPVATTMTGPQVYNTACLACHSTGVGGAPVVGDAAQWTDRVAQGMDVLYDHAINGFDGEALTPMLPKGGRIDLSDQEVQDAVDYMIAESS
jgi:cytochrome c5